MKDLANSIAVVSTLDPDTRTADANGTGIDLQGFESATIVAQVGAEGITLSSSNKIELVLEDSDDDSTYAAVTSSTSVTDGTVDSSGIFASFTANGDAPAIHTLGYVGGKRDVRGKPDFSGTHGTGTEMSACVIKGHPHHSSSTDGS